MSSRSNRAKSAITTTILAAAAGLALAGCGGEENPEVYCVNGENEVIDEDLCDHTNGSYNAHGSYVPYFLFVGDVGGHRYSSGQKIPSDYISRGQRISPTNATARANAGLPKTGPVSSGTRISGGIGTGKAGGSAKGGSGGG